MSKQKQNTQIRGLHVVMAANQKGGASKSTTIAEVAAGLETLKIPTIIVNLEVTKTNVDTANQRLKTMLRGSNILDLECSDVSKVLTTFGQILDAAEDKAVILMDVPGAMMTAGNAIWDNLLASDYFNDVDSFSLIGTVSNEPDHFNTAVHVTNAVEHANKHVFYRGWNNPIHSTALQDMQEWKAVSKAYPSIVMPARHDLMEYVLFGRGEFTEVPGLIKLRDWYQTSGAGQPRRIRKPVELVLQAVDSMADFLDKHYLPKIR